MTTITKLKAALADLTDHCSPQYSDAVLKIATVIAEMEAGEPVAWCTSRELEAMAKGFSQDVPARAMRIPQSYPEGAVVPLFTHPQPKTEPVEDSDLLAALAEVRDLFPMPEHGSPVEREWAAAMADPYNVPNYVRACIAQPKADEWNARGSLARLKCWHRLTREESDELVSMQMQWILKTQITQPKAEPDRPVEANKTMGPVQEPAAKDVNSAHTIPASDCVLSNNDYHEAEIAIMGSRLFRAVERMTNPSGESAHEMVDWLCDDSGMFKLFEKYFSPSAAPQAKPLITREQHFALREAFAIGAADSYFEAYPTHDNSVGRMIFERGFVRGFDSHERAIEAAHGIA